jgi:phage host-nuclease inhibitor protein Gam
MDDEGKMSGTTGKGNPSNPAQTTELVERSKQVFLREIVNEFRRKQQQYDVGVEFAKTRRNRSLLVPLTIIGLIAIFSVVVIGVTRYIQSASRSIQVNIQDFADVNLRDVLDEASRLQTQLAAARRELEQVRTTLENGVSQVERNRDRAIQLLQEEELSAAARNTRTQQLESQAQSEIASLNAEYLPRIEELDARIADLQDQIAQYDSRQLEQAREQEQILDNQRQLHELEINQIREEYEAEIAEITDNYEREISELETYQRDFEATVRQRHANEIARLIRLYNPRLEGEATGELLNAPETEAAAAFGGVGSYSPMLSREGIVSRGRYEELASQYAAIGTILGRLREVPYENSVPEALTQIDRRTRDLIAGYESIREGLEETVLDRDSIIAARNTTIAEQEGQIQEFLFALDELARVNGDTGYILDPRDPEEVVVYVSRIRSVEVGSIGYVFRRDDEFVGTIRFVLRDGRVGAELVDTVEDMHMRAFDKVLIDVQ